MPSPRRRALSERWHWVLTVWPSVYHRERNGFAIRAASGVLSATGEQLSITLPGGITGEFPFLLDPDLEVPSFLSMEGSSQSFTLPWIWDQFTPIDLDLRYAIGELARLWESSGGTALEPWASRTVVIDGEISGAKWGMNREFISFDLRGREVADSGELWPSGAELDSTRFVDIASTAARARAPQSDGVLPPIVYAPVGSSLKVPIRVVVDEDDAASPVNLIPRRYHLGARRPASSGSSHQFVLWHPAREGQFMAVDTSASYRAVPTLAQDARGRDYWGVGDATYPFRELFGNASVDFVFGSLLPTLDQAAGLVAIDDQVKASTDGDDDYAIITSIEGAGAVIDRGYTGAGVVNGQGHVIRLPIASRADVGYHVCTLGGDDSPDGTGPISEVIDVLIDLLRYSQFSLPVSIGDLVAMRGRLKGLHVSAVLNERIHPYDWATSKLLAFLPIRPYLHNGYLRFGWVGPVSEEEIITTIDLSDYGPAFRLEPLSWGSEPGIPIWRLQYWYDVATERFRKTLTVDGSQLAIDSSATRTTFGRAIDAWREYQQRTGERSVTTAPTKQLQLDAFELGLSAGMLAEYMVYLGGVQRQRVRLEVDGSYSWLEPGHVIRVTEPGVTRVSQTWRVEVASFAPSGSGHLLLEHVEP